MEALYNRGTKSNDKTLVDWNAQANRRHCRSAFLIGTCCKKMNALWSNLSKDLKQTN
jgi:hypothetical protein